MRETSFILYNVEETLKSKGATPGEIKKATEEVEKGLELKETGKHHECNFTPVKCADISFCKTCGFIQPFK